MAQIYEVRAQHGDHVHSFGARDTRVEAEQLLERSKERIAFVGGRNDRYWIEEIDTTGLFEIPPRPTPRERYAVRVTPRPRARDEWQTVDVEILDGDRVVASYHRNYAMLRTFEPFRQGDSQFALISPHYTATSVVDLACGEIVAAEDPNADGFCPVGFYVPDWWDVHAAERSEPPVRPGTLSWRDEHEWPSRGDFGFVWGCVWGDDASWKVQYLDLSGVQEGVLRREERFGDVRLATHEQLEPREFIGVRGPRHVKFAVEQSFDLASGRPLGQEEE